MNRTAPPGRSVFLCGYPAAHADAGKFDKAIELEQRAVDLATQQNKTVLAQVLTDRLAILRNGTPVRQLGGRSLMRVARLRSNLCGIWV